MRKLFILLILTLCSNQLSAQLYQTFNLDEFIARHPTTRSYDPISRSFNGSEKLRQQLASLSITIAQLNGKLEAMKLDQSKDAKAFLDAGGAPDENAFWQSNRVKGNETDDLKSQMIGLIDQKKQIELLLPRDTVILPEINELAADIRARLTDDAAVYLNYLPPPTPSNLAEKWLSSPLQIFLWTPQEKYIEEYLDSTYAVSLIFPESLRPVVYQKSVKGANER